MFSHMVVSLFILILFFLAMQKLFILMRSHLFILPFMSVALGDISVKIQLHEISKTFLPMFSSKTLTLSQHIFKSFITLNFFFCEWCKLVLKLHLFCMQLSSSSNSIYWRGYFYSLICWFPVCWKLIDHTDSDLLLGCLFCSISLCAFLCQYQAVLITVPHFFIILSLFCLYICAQHTHTYTYLFLAIWEFGHIMLLSL